MTLLFLLSCVDYNVSSNNDNEPPVPQDSDTPEATLPEEVCNGDDDDGDGAVDEDFTDSDADGVADCVDVEDCDGLDNDGDGSVDENFPDTDEDQLPDCLDIEDCDGLDNDGDGSVDEDFPDTDEDQLPDCLDIEDCDGLDNDGDASTDEGFDDNNNGIADCFEEEAYCTPFDDFSDWSYTGSGDWHVEEGMLTEGRGGTYNAIAWLHDLGLSDRFAIQVDIGWTGSLNDIAGVVWGIDGEESLAVLWDDPQNDYQRHRPPGAISLSHCVAGICTALAEDASSNLTRPADKTFATLSVTVEGDQVTATLDGVPVLSATDPSLVGRGPGVVGLYSNDNDGGVWFDEFCVWNDAAP